MESGVAGGYLLALVQYWDLVQNRRACGHVPRIAGPDLSRVSIIIILHIERKEFRE